MSLREKSAWITLVTVLGCFGVYFGSLATGAVGGHDFVTLHLFLACVAAMAALQCGLHLIAGRTTPRDGRAPRDERELQIQWRSHTLGYYVLVASVLALFIPTHVRFPGRAWPDAIDMLNFALLGVVVATLVVAVAQIVMFRRGV